MKRFTETTKWSDPWFRSLSPKLKLLWIWLLDNCDHSGVIRPDFELASFQIGEPVNHEQIVELGERLKSVTDGKLHITKFVKFQYGVGAESLSIDSSVHRGVIKSLRLHGLLDNPSVSLSQPLPNCLVTTKDKDKDKDKVQEGVQGEILPKPSKRIGEVFDTWNGYPGLAKILVLSDKRRHLLSVRLADPFFSEHWPKAIAKISESAFCRGENDRGWKADFDFFLRPDTVAKVMEGKYDDKKKSPNPASALWGNSNRKDLNAGRVPNSQSPWSF